MIIVLLCTSVCVQFQQAQSTVFMHGRLTGGYDHAFTNNTLASGDHQKKAVESTAEVMKQAVQSLDVEKVIFPVQINAESKKTADRNGILIRRSNAVGTVLLCHGYMTSKYEALFFKHMFPDFNAFSFDFRSHGADKSEHHTTLGLSLIHI